MKRYVIGMMAILLFLAVTGCGRLDITVRDDGSGEANYTGELAGKVTARDIRGEIEKQIEKANKNAGGEVIRLDRFEEKDGKMSAKVKFDRISALGGTDDSLLVTVDDLKRIYPDRIRELTDVKNRSAIGPETIAKIGDKPVLYLDDLDDDMEITVTVPGKIVYASGGTVSEQNSRSLLANDDRVVIVYDPSNGMSAAVWLVVLAVVAIVLFVLYRIGLFDNIMSGRKGGGIPNAQ
ncbi:hypothetical protein [Paenibacillus sp. GYB003]|uniref:hypothetical protein n=1 Tax=Paenibacillus sp. GYB003 TaxID=2994392 RepID=UPI002F964C67